MWGAISSEGWKRRLLSQDHGILKASMDYVKDCTKLCNALDGRQFNVCLFSEEQPNTDRTHRITADSDKEKAAFRVAPLLSDLCKYSKDLGVTLLLEPLNRYSTPYCSSSRDAMRIARLVDQDSLMLMLDTFHMNIEEDSFDSAVQEAAPFLRHMHVADNNRKMPGRAHIDFGAVSAALTKVGYNGFLTFEPNIPGPDYDNDLKFGLEFIQGVFSTTK
jgi:sugar phosphate isomerase/epimerase